MNDNISFVAQNYATRFHQAAAGARSIAGNICVDVARVKAKRAMISISSLFEGKNFTPAVIASKGFVTNDEIFSFMHEIFKRGLEEESLAKD